MQLDEVEESQVKTLVVFNHPLTSLKGTFSLSSNLDQNDGISTGRKTSQNN
jgi:hypothetical protein